MLKKLPFLFIALPFLYAQCLPNSLSIATGAYDFYRDKYRTFEFFLEYKFSLACLKKPNPYVNFRPLVGVMATAEQSFYGYAGINFEILFAKRILFAPGFAAGYFAPGNGKQLGYPLEFRSGVELAWQFNDLYRLGIHFYHLSNASLGHKNPGSESLVLFYDIPITKGFPFNRDN
jgi:lipid A 3-O-deacylase